MGTVAFTNNTPITEKGDKASRAFWKVLEEVLVRTGGPTNAFYAADTTFSPAGSIASNNVQDALEELDAEKQTKDATLTALAALSTAADRLIYATGADAFALTTFTAFARTLLDDVDAAAMRTTLGLAIGTDVQAYSANLASWSAKTVPTGTVVGTSDSQTLTNKTLTSPAINNPTGTMTLASGVLGYAAGNGGTVTQLISKATAVTLDEPSGEITMNNGGIAAGATATFTFNNTTIAATDVFVINHVGGGTLGAYRITPVCDAGFASISVKNDTAGLLSEAIVLRYVVIKGATS